MRQARRPAPKTEEERLERIEEAKQKARDRSNKYYHEHKEKVKKYGEIYRKENKEVIKERDHKYYEKNKEWINKQNMENAKKPKSRVRQKEYRARPENRERQNAYNKMYYEENREDLIKYGQEYVSKNKEKTDEYQRWYAKDLKIRTLNAIGGCRCVICGDEDLTHLTIDHIDSTGHIDKKNGLSSKRLRQAIVKGRLPKDRLNNLRCLCFNHNCSTQRGYLDLEWKDQTASQRHQAKLWREAFAFFGPCHCGESNLKFLTISHIHNDGAERRKKGEGSARDLLVSFRKQGWPESLKEDYCIECFNHNCSRGDKIATPTSPSNSAENPD
jgi:serine/threonine protein phosphatase PrpC